MMRNTQRFMIILAVILIFFGLSVFAQAEDVEKKNFSGGFRAGYRLVDVSGAETEYKHQINLYDGVRLFDFHINYQPLGEESRKFVDLLEVDASNLGGDPFETLRFDVRKFGKYDFKYNRRKSVYFYDDMIAPDHYDLHKFNFERTLDTASLNIWLSDKGKLRLGVNRYEKKGESTTSLDIARDEFEFDKPIDEEKNDYLLGLDYKLHDRVTIVLEEKIRDYKNTNSLFLPGASAGEDPEDTAQLNYFYQDQPYDFKSFAHTLRLNTRPTDRFILLAAATLENLDMDVDFSENADGTNFAGEPLSTSLLGKGNVKRDIQLYDADLSYLINDRVALVGAFRYHDFAQDGDMTVDNEKEGGKWDYSITGLDGGVQFQVSPEVVLSGGLRYESRQVESSLLVEEASRTRTYPDTNLLGAFGNVNWRLLTTLNLTADYQYGSADDPFTLASPSDYHRLRLGARYRMDSGLSLIGYYLLRRNKNDTSDWTSDLDQLDLQVGYHRDDLNCSLGYSLILVERAIDQQVSYGDSEPTLFPILYEGNTNLFTGQALWNLSTQWALGGDFHIYDNSGSEALSNANIRAFVEYTLRQNYLLNLGYRYANFEENDGLNDYSANITEFSVGYLW